MAMSDPDTTRGYSWGPETHDDGSTTFRLWAPAIEQVCLHVLARGKSLTLEQVGDGWHELRTDAVAVGGGYQFEMPDGLRVPDPASRAQAGDVHGPSVLVGPDAYTWQAQSWRGRPWSDAVVYELHPGTFTEAGTFAGISDKLAHLVDLGVTAIELMPIAQFMGRRGWGYDGVLMYAPHNAYGSPDDLRALIDEAHTRGLMVLLDVVYNHFGPDGNYLHVYAPEFFNTERHTPWGAAIDYTREPVRRFAIENALYWLDAFRFDGLRLDAINQIRDPSEEHVLERLAREVRAAFPGRHIHLTTEDDRNVVHLHRRDDQGRPTLYTGEWNDDMHHVFHVLATGEDDGYYQDYSDDPAGKLVRGLAEGYVYQGEPSPFWDRTPRGEPSGHLPPDVFVNFLQNHDQIGNRAFGERLTRLAPAEALDCMTAIYLLSPQIPLIYMGEEWAETNPFYFFTDFTGDLADAVRKGRRNEFRQWREFADPDQRERIPDPNAHETFAASRIDWSKRDRDPHRARNDLMKSLVALRQANIVPLLATSEGAPETTHAQDGGAFEIVWQFGEQTCLAMTANVSGVPARRVKADGVAGDIHARLDPVFALPDSARMAPDEDVLPPWSVIVSARRPGS
jgi:maltooligosyltrehalose trehalohydrolase